MAHAPGAQAKAKPKKRLPSVPYTTVRITAGSKSAPATGVPPRPA